MVLGELGMEEILSISPEGTRSNRDASGAVVTIEVNGRRQMRKQVGGGSDQSANDHRCHFGLGEATRVEKVEVRWPSGQTDRFGGLDADAAYRLREGDPMAKRCRSLPRRGATHQPGATPRNLGDPPQTSP
jgi:hypothetical protein